MFAGLRANDRVGRTVLRQEPPGRPPIFVNYCLHFELMFIFFFFIIIFLVWSFCFILQLV